MIKFFGELFREVLEDVVGYDSRLRHTIAPLLFNPGKITNDYIRDRRLYYVLPLRLYLITSVLFIVLLKLNTDTQAIIPIDDKEPAVASEVIALNAPTAKPTQPNEEQASISGAKNTPSQSQSAERVDDQNFGIHFEGDELTFKGKEFQEGGAFKAFADEIEKKWQAWKNDPAPLVKQVYELLPYMMFILLPIFAVILKLFYCFSKRYYVEHLIFLIHNHSFIYVALMLNMGLAGFYETFAQSGALGLRVMAEIADGLTTLIMIWMFVYIFLSMRRVYRQSWLVTLVKGTLLGSVYFTLISVGFVVTLLIGAYLA